MTREEAKHRAEIFKAFSEGKEIEHLNHKSEWVPVEESSAFNDPAFRYRIKPEPRIRPYANTSEVLLALREHGPSIEFGKHSYNTVTQVDDVGIWIITGLHDFRITFSNLVRHTWQDGTPCGVIEA